MSAVEWMNPSRLGLVQFKDYFNKQSPSLDEIDNKPNVTSSLSYVLFAMHDKYRSEQERLATFEHWPLDFIDKRTLALTGMFYTRECDKVKCYFCEVEIGRWEETDNPVDEHVKWSPNCPLMRRRTTNNIPINADALDRVLPPISYDVCGSQSIQMRPSAVVEDSISSSSSSMPAPSYTYQMEHPEYAIEAARYRSFAEWPRTMKQKPRELAEAGFFYTGVGDRVNCFSCGCGLKDWDESDDPWEQHALWLSKCRYLKLMKGQEYIDAVAYKYKSAAKSSEEALNGDSDVVSQECGTQTEGGQQKQLSKNTTATPALTSSSAETFVRAEGLVKDTLKEGVPSLSTATTTSSTTEKKIPEDRTCKICYAAEYNTAFMPCGHVVACAKCASSVTKCPMCRKPFTDIMRVFFS